MRNYKRTIIGSTILITLLLMSILYPLYGPADFHKQAVLVKNEYGRVIDRAPFPPSGEHWLGTTRNGEQMHWILLYGVKFTLITAFGVAFLRVLFGGLFGLFLSLGMPYLKSYFKDFFLSMRYIPSILIAIILMMPIVGAFNDVAISSIVTYQIIILVFIGFPTVTLFTSDVTDQLIKTSFVQSSFLMGASKLHIVKRHLLPYMRSYGLLFTVQQIISTLQIMMQLSIFGLFLGGLNRAGIVGYDDEHGRPKAASLTMEWAGLIGQNFTDFVMVPWIVFIPVFGFFFLIIIVNMIKKEIEENILGEKVVKKARKKENFSHEVEVSLKKFELVRQKRGVTKESI